MYNKNYIFAQDLFSMVGRLVVVTVVVAVISFCVLPLKPVVVHFVLLL